MTETVGVAEVSASKATDSTNDGSLELAVPEIAAGSRPELPWTGERCVPEHLGSTSLLVFEHTARYWWAAFNLRKAPKNAVVLDAPSGAGYGSAILAQSPRVAIVVGTDIDQQAVEYARDRYGMPGKVVFTVQDMAKIRTKADAVVSFEGIEHVDDQQAAARALCDALKPGGLLMVSTPRADGTAAGSAFHTHELSLDEFVGLFAPYLDEYTVHGQQVTVGDRAPEEARYFILEGIKRA
jgi:O-antigen biosynthesis protein